MKKFLVTVILGYAAIVLLILVTTQLKGTSSSKSISQSSSDRFKQDSASQGRTESAGNSVQQTAGETLAERTTSKIEKEKSIRQFKTYFKTGRVSSQWDFENGRLAGEVHFFSMDGLKKRVLPFAENAVSGTLLELDAGGGVFSSITFTGGALDGPAVFYYPGTGQAWAALEFAEGQPAGGVRFFSENGEVQDFVQKVALSPDTETAQGVFRVLSEDGGVRSEWSHESSGERQSAKAYYRNGQTSAVWALSGGQLDGGFVLYGPDGKMRVEWIWEGREVSGTLRYYDSAGGLQRETAFRKGVLEGSDRIYYDDASLLCEIVYENGKLSHLPQAYSQGQAKSRIPAA